MLRRYLRPLIYSIFIGIALYAAMIGVSGYHDIKVAFAKVDLTGLLIIFGLSLVNYLIRFVRWHWYIMKLGYALPFRHHVLYYFSGFALTTTPGKAGEAIRSVYLKRHGVSLTNSLATLFAERFSDLMAMSLLAGLAAVHFSDYQVVEIGIVVTVVIMLVIMQNNRAIEFIHAVLNRVVFRKFHPLTGKLFRLIRSSSSLLKSWILTGGLLMGIISWGAEGVAFYYLLDMLNIPVSLWLGIGIYAISVLVGAISFIPGGLGSTEAVMGLLLIAVGAGPGDAVAATVICRVATLWFAVVLGFVALFWLEIRNPSFPLSNGSSSDAAAAKKNNR